MLSSLPEIRWNDAVDILLVALLVWTALAWLRQTRSRLALVGVVFLSAIYLAARQLELQLTVSILQGLSAVLVIVLAVVFQDDLRRFFEQIAVWGLRRRPPVLPSDDVDLLIRVVRRQCRRRTGALYVFPGRESLEPHLEGGVDLDARLSEALLHSLFDTHSPGHDGAVVMTGSRVSRFGAVLPLSGRTEKLGDGGTRHAAALGLAERTDALVVVVSEERGVASVARGGEIRALESAEALGDEIRSFLDRIAPAPERAGAWRALRRWPEAALALALALATWTVLVPGSNPIEVERRATVVVEDLPGGYTLLEVKPPTIRVQLRGPRIYLPRESDTLRALIHPDPGLVQQGRRTFPVFASQLEVSPHLSVSALTPDHVFLSLASPDSQ